jgi:hypothetical protein
MIERPAIVKALLDAGFESGWAASEDRIILWEHDEDPPAPYTRPEGANQQ